MPTRRIFELMIVTIILTKPAFGVLHVWSRKTLDNTEPGTLFHSLAEIVTVIS